MKRTKVKQMLAWLLSFSMVAGSLFGDSVLVTAEGTTGNASGKIVDFPKMINLGTKGILAPLRPAGSGSEWRGDYVYFGHDHFRYRVLDPSTTEFGTNESTVLLESDTVREEKKLTLDGTRGWEEVRKYLNEDFLDRYFNDAEKKAIAPSTKEEASEQDGRGYNNLMYAPLPESSIFLLDAREVTRPSYGYYDNKNNKARTRVKNKDGEAASWWLRSYCSVEYDEQNADTTRFQGGVVSPEGVIRCIADHPVEADLTQGLSPALNLKPSEVVFTSCAHETEGYGKPAGTVADGGSLVKVEDYDTVDNVGHEYKLTLKSGEAAPGITEPYWSGDQLGFAWTGGVPGENTKLSAIITSGEGENETILYYGTLSDVKTAGGEKSIRLPEEFDSKEHKLKLFFEHRNGNGMTDYAGDMAEVEIPYRAPTPKPVETPVATVAPTATPVATIKPAEPEETPAVTLKPGEPEGTPAVTGQPGEAEKPEGTPAVTGQPGEAEKPKGTPAVTDQPGETEKPEGTPVATNQPVETDKPGGTPAATDRPEGTLKPEGTPAVTEKPEKTEKPEEPTETPAVTKAPGETDKLERPVMTPAVTEKPAPVTTAAPAGTPAVTGKPAVTKTPAVADEPDDPDDEVSFEKESRGKAKAAGTKDREPKTGEDSARNVYATVAMVAGLSYLLLYFADEGRGMTEEKKKELVTRLARWAKKGGRLRKAAAFTAIVGLLVYYHAIGKRVSPALKEMCGE